MIHNELSSNAWKQTFAVMWLAQFVGMSAITGVVSFLPLYVTQLGVTDTSSLGLWAGILMGATSFCAAVANPYWGAIADRKGRKMMVEKVLFVFGLLMMCMAFVTNVYELLLLRIFQGLCGGFVASATALGISMTPKHKIPFAVGMFQTALIVGGAVGPMLGGIIADAFGYRLPFIAFGILCLLTLIIIRFSVHEHFVPVEKKDQSSIKDTLHDLWSVTDLRLMLIVLFLAQFAMQSIGPILPIYIQSMVSGTSTLASISGTIIAIGGITSAVASASMGLFSKKFSHYQILVVAAMLCAITFIGQLAAANIIMLGLLRAVNGFCIGMMIPSANTIVTYLIPEEQRGAAYGVTGGAALMGNVLGPLCAGLFSIVFGITSIFWVTSLLFLAVFGLLFHHIRVTSTKTYNTAINH
jgi:DHA1 family multidrug resistance protein-like MFS transporter